MSLRRFVSAAATYALAALVPFVLTAGCPNLIPDGNGNANDNANVNDNGSTNDNANENENENDNSDAKGDSGITGRFAGSTRCLLCHANQHDDWSGTLHSTALETLEEIGQGTNAECLSCHTVGFGEDGGFVNRATTNSLAGVGCESCHGPAADHANNVNDASLRPPVDLSASICSECHQGSFHPNGEDWAMSAHAEVREDLVERFTAGTSLNSCGSCHSGDFFYRASILGEEDIPDDLLAGLTAEEMTPITCAICHDPHQQTGNAVTPEDGRDYQLRFPEVAYPTPTNTIEATTDPSRFNLCGQCHHARERVWTDTSREPHPSDQVNVFFGEMPLPDSDPTPIVPTRASVHLNTGDQCATCHVVRAAAIPGELPAVSGHTFAVNYDGCVECHGSAEVAQALATALELELEFRAERVLEALDAWTDDPARGNGTFWEYTSEGGPDSDGQATIPDEIKKARYLYYYVIQGGGNGVHNPDYVREALMLAEEYADSAGALLP